MGSTIHRIEVVDSHTAGEPTRVVIAGGPDLGGGPLAARMERFRLEYDGYRRAVLNEPRGVPGMVGALLLEPLDPGCATAVIFFDNAGYLGMCGHGSIGLMTTLAHRGRIDPGEHRIETSAGIVTAVLAQDGSVCLANVPSYRLAKDVQIQVGIGAVSGDIAWGGNWFFLVEEHGQDLAVSRVPELSDYCQRVRRALNAQGHPQVDHVALFAPRPAPGIDARNFVLCPGLAYDRSPCGTGTSAKLACLAADGRLREGEEWIQQSIIGSTFSARYRRAGERIIPLITGRAYITGEATLLLDDQDPYCWGI